MELDERFDGRRALRFGVLEIVALVGNQAGEPVTIEARGERIGAQNELLAKMSLGERGGLFAVGDRKNVSILDPSKRFARFQIVAILQ
ncbi:MAG: hypothetical protein AAFV29_25560, partial [Myxococcota bacterium]